ncbi:MAG: isoprenylcysteine carboxylmethyltransferase family protein [Gammaproteobacteria bacterium]|jgi:protein-S-isoprenylcysteine O-methyltransferase Ste14
MKTLETGTSQIIAPPPLLYLAAMLIGGLLHVITSATLYSNDYFLSMLGALVFVVSAVFARWAFLTMKTAGTSASPYESSQNLTTTGPFKYSRNPIYVAMTGLYIGFALLINAIWPLIMLIPLLAIMQWGVIFREERYLNEQFGKAYLNYKKNVRRWL